MVNKGVAAERSSGPFMFAKRLRILPIRAFAEKRRPVSGSGEQRRHPDQAVVAAEKMRARAAPRIVFGPRDEAGANRVEFHIPCCGERVPVVHHVRSEASLPEITAPPFAPVDLRRIAPVSFTDGPAEAIGRSRNHDEVDVVRHEAVGPDLDLAAVAPFCSESDVEAVIVRAEERPLSTVTALRDVVRQGGDDYAGQASHGERVARIAETAVRASYVSCPQISSPVWTATPHPE
jgi:hypothetical protein